MGGLRRGRRLDWGESLSPEGKKKVKCGDFAGSVRARGPRPKVGGGLGGGLPRATNGVGQEKTGADTFPRKLRADVAPLN